MPKIKIESPCSPGIVSPVSNLFKSISLRLLIVRQYEKLLTKCRNRGICSTSAYSSGTIRYIDNGNRKIASTRACPQINEGTN